MPDIIDDFPLAAESPESILARLQADLNAGIDPNDPLYADMLPGSVWDDLARADALEFDRIYDRLLTDVPAASLPALATGVWLDQWADAVGLERRAAAPAGGTVTFTGANGTAIASGTQVSTEAPTADADPITFQTISGGTISGGTLDLDVVAVEDGSAGNVAANSITISDSIGGVTVTNAGPMTGGDDIESDERLQLRVLGRLRGVTGAGNIDYYANLALNYPGVGFVTVQPNTPALGDVRVVISDVNNDPVPSFMITGLQAILDPSGSSTQGAGSATIGAQVTVTTPTSHNVTVVAHITPESGYSADGSGGTISVSDDITAAVTRYVEGLADADVVIHNKILAAIIDVEGVADVTVTTPAADVAIAAGEVAVLTAVTIT